MGDNTVIYIDKNRGIASDMLYSAKTVQDDPTNSKKKFLAAGAGTLGLLGAAAYLGSKRPASGLKDLSKLQQAKAIGIQTGILGGLAGGAYYAYKNIDNKRKMYTGIGASALSASILCGILAKSPSPMNQKLYAAAVYGTAAALPTAIALTGRLGQTVHNERLVSDLQSRGLSEEEINNVIDKQHGKNPELRYVDTSAIPGAIKEKLASSIKNPLRDAHNQKNPVGRFFSNLMGRQKEKQFLKDELKKVMDSYDSNSLKRNEILGSGDVSPQKMQQIKTEAINDLLDLNYVKDQTRLASKDIDTSVLKTRAATAGTLLTAGGVRHLLSNKEEQEKNANAKTVKDTTMGILNRYMSAMRGHTELKRDNIKELSEQLRKARELREVDLINPVEYLEDVGNAMQRSKDRNLRLNMETAAAQLGTGVAATAGLLNVGPYIASRRTQPQEEETNK